MLVAATLVDVVMLEKHGRRQDDVSHARGLGHKLLVDAGEQVVAREALLDEGLLGCDRNRIGVLDEDGGDRRPTGKIIGVVRQNGTDPCLIEHAYRWIP